MLLERHYDQVHRLCRRMCGNDADADDATQEALVAVARGLASFDGRAALTTWVHRVTVNACLDELRRRSRRPSPSEDVPTGPTGGSAGATDEPGELVALRLDLDAALAALAPEVRAAVVLRDVAGHDYAAIAAILDVPLGTVRSRISRGRARLAELLRERNPSPSPERPTP